MIIISNQWQGSGITDEILHGTNVLKEYFKDCKTEEIPLSHKDLAIKNSIIAYEAIYEQTQNFRNIVHEYQPETITTIGGDCGVEIIPVSYLNKKYPKLGILWFDAHGDLNTPASSPSGAFHGMPVRLLLGEGDETLSKLCWSKITSNQLLFIGLRELDKPEEEYIKSKQIYRTSALEYDKLSERIQEQAFEHLYIHLDLDVFDPSMFPYTKYPTPDGLDIAKLLSVLKKLKADYDIVGYSMTEGTMKTREEAKPIEEIIEFFKEQGQD